MTVAADTTRTDAIVAYARDYGLDTLVETGLDQGGGSGMAAGVARYIAIDRNLWNVDAARERGFDARLGDSGELMPGVLAELDGPALFFLDAHGVDCHEHVPIGKDTWPGWAAMPLLRELEAISVWAHGARSVVLVDDMPQMAKWIGVGMAGEPDERMFYEYLDSTGIGWQRELRDGILRLTP